MDPPIAVHSVPKIRVLVADDEQIIVTTLATILELAGYDVCAVYGGEAALRLLDLLKPDLVITDVTMPVVRGFEVAYAARATLPRCKILLFSGHASLHELLRTGASDRLSFDLMTKPIHAGELLHILRRGLRDGHPALLVPVDIDEENIH